jgi:dTDP-4-amino-4,6-dideoxygalactose transaminase
VSQPLEHVLTQRFDGLACRLFPRGSTGLFALFRTLRELSGPGDVLVPEICCESVALSALYAGLVPVPVDCDPETFCLSPEAVARQVSPATRAVVLVYVFGHLTDPAPFVSLARAHDFVLVEDLAQAVGGQRHGDEIGRAGDFTLLSFAADKILPGAGGALVQRTPFDDAAYERSVRSLPAAASPRVLQQKAASLRNFCHGLYDLARVDPAVAVAPAFTRMAPAYRDLFVRAGGIAAPETTLQGLERLPVQRASRYARYRAYREGIRNPHVRVAELPEGAMCWRCCLVAETPEDAFLVTDELRRASLPASNHYFPLGRLFYDRAAPTAADLGDRLVNLWVDDTVTDDRLRQTVEIVNACTRSRDPRRRSWTS